MIFKNKKDKSTSLYKNTMLEIILTNVHMQELHIARITKVISGKCFQCEIAHSANLVGGRQMGELQKQGRGWIHLRW